MLLIKQVQIVNKVARQATELEHIYVNEKLSYEELKKLNQSLVTLANYLNGKIKANSHADAGDLNGHIEAINLHLDILKELITDKDYRKLAKSVKLITTTLNYHPKEYTYWSFIKAWFLEWIYFI